VKKARRCQRAPANAPLGQGGSRGFNPLGAAQNESIDLRAFILALWFATIMLVLASKLPPASHSSQQRK
jgi:hypothetical protein